MDRNTNNDIPNEEIISLVSSNHSDSSSTKIRRSNHDGNSNNNNNNNNNNNHHHSTTTTTHTMPMEMDQESFHTSSTTIRSSSSLKKKYSLLHRTKSLIMIHGKGLLAGSILILITIFIKEVATSYWQDFLIQKDIGVILNDYSNIQSLHDLEVEYDFIQKRCYVSKQQNQSINHIRIRYSKMTIRLLLSLSECNVTTKGFSHFSFSFILLYAH